VDYVRRIKELAALGLTGVPAVPFLVRADDEGTLIGHLKYLREQGFKRQGLWRQVLGSLLIGCNVPCDGGGALFLYVPGWIYWSVGRGPTLLPRGFQGPSVVVSISHQPIVHV
jgi:hypothetical protein